MNYRPATTADVPAVLTMVRQIAALHEQWDRERCGLKGDPTRSYDPWLRARCSDPESVFLVAETGPPGQTRLVAYLVGTVEKEIPIYWMPRCGWIHDLWVEEDFRHEGIGRQLTLLAIERFAALGVSQVRLQTASANDAGRRLFESCGFRECCREMLFSITPPEGRSEKTG
ncbi:MAG: GNAT family N-acetyltransferase [Phycisphaerae bacterium]|nr:GNAT family N-acetyltransferase [Phycisphaerae bacterium]